MMRFTSWTGTRGQVADHALWENAIAEERIMVSKDSDFFFLRCARMTVADCCGYGWEIAGETHCLPRWKTCGPQLRKHLRADSEWWKSANPKLSSRSHFQNSGESGKNKRCTAQVIPARATKTEPMV